MDERTFLVNFERGGGGPHRLLPHDHDHHRHQHRHHQNGHYHHQESDPIAI